MSHWPKGPLSHWPKAPMSHWPKDPLSHWPKAVCHIDLNRQCHSGTRAIREHVCVTHTATSFRNASIVQERVLSNGNKSMSLSNTLVRHSGMCVIQERESFRNVCHSATRPRRRRRSRGLLGGHLLRLVIGKRVAERVGERVAGCVAVGRSRAGFCSYQRRPIRLVRDSLEASRRCVR